MDTDELKASAEELERFRFRLLRLLAHGRRHQLRRLMARWAWSAALPPEVRGMDSDLDLVRQELATHVAVRLGPHPHHQALPALESFFRELGELGIGDRRELAGLALGAGVHWAPPGPWRRLRGSHPLAQATLALALAVTGLGALVAAWWANPVEVSPCLLSLEDGRCSPLDRALISFEERFLVRCRLDPGSLGAATVVSPRWTSHWELLRTSHPRQTLAVEEPCDLGRMLGARRLAQADGTEPVAVRQPLPESQAAAVRLGEGADAETCCWFPEPPGRSFRQLEARGLAVDAHLEALDLATDPRVVQGTRLGLATSCDMIPTEARATQDLSPGAWACTTGIQDEVLAGASPPAEEHHHTDASHVQQIVFEPCHYAATWSHNRRPSPTRYEASPVAGCLDLPLGGAAQPVVSELLAFHDPTSELALDVTLHGELLNLEDASWTRRWTAVDAQRGSHSRRVAAVPRPGQQRTFLFRDLLGEASGWMRRAGSRGLGAAECALARDVLLQACGLPTPVAPTSTEDTDDP